MPLLPEARTEPIVTVTRGGQVESVHLGHVVVATPEGRVHTLVGDADTWIYPRSALKPFQAIAVVEALAAAGQRPSSDQVAVISASHDGGDGPQVTAAALLAEAGLDETALQCPADWPADDRVLGQLHEPTSLSHNCSGKHAGMLWAHTASGQPAATYLDPDNALQRRIAELLRELTGREPRGPVVDGCGAPAWMTTVGGLAVAFARLCAATTAPLSDIRQAMASHPELIGGPSLPDTLLMSGDSRVIAKRGAEGVMGACLDPGGTGPLGIAVKVLDGGNRAAGPAVAGVLQVLGAQVPPDLVRGPVMGGGRRQGDVAPTESLLQAARALRTLRLPPLSTS